jgi:hypothetical protein
MVTMSLVRDKHTTNAPPWRYDKSDVISNLAGARDFALLPRPDMAMALDFWDLIVKEKFVEPDPGVGTFKVRIRVRVTYPSVPTQSKRLFGTSKLPVAVLVHGNHGVWGSVTDGGKTGTTKTISTPFGSTTLDVHEIIGSNLRPASKGTPTCRTSWPSGASCRSLWTATWPTRWTCSSRPAPT